MKYLKRTFSYLKKNIWLPLVVMIVPAVAACFLSTPYWEVSFVAAFTDPTRATSNAFDVLFGDSWQYIWPVVVISVFQIFGATLVMSAVDKHFRTGKLSLRMPLRLVNNAIFPMTVGVLIMCAISILWRFALYGLVSLVQVAARAFNMLPGATLSIIGVLAVVLFFFHVLVITPILFWSPTMFIYGYRFRDAAATSFKMISGQKVFWGLFLPLVVCSMIQMLVGFLGVHYAVSTTVDFFIFLITNVYVPVYVLIAFYEISGLERRDIKSYENIPLPTVDIRRKPEPAASENKKPEQDVKAQSEQNIKPKKQGRKKSRQESGEGGDVV